MFYFKNSFFNIQRKSGNLDYKLLIIIGLPDQNVFTDSKT